MKLLKSKLFLLFIVVMCSLSAWEWGDTYDDWKAREELEEARKNCPFSAERISKYVKDLTTEYFCPARTIKYDFILALTESEKDAIYQGFDRKLKIDLRFDLKECDPMKPLSCQIEGGYKRPFYASDIAVFQINGKQVVYLVSFLETDATLVITRQKESALTAQWCVMRSTDLLTR